VPSEDSLRAPDHFNSRQINMRRIVPLGWYRAKILGSTRLEQQSG
jgi:hypothetical protein